MQQVVNVKATTLVRLALPADVAAAILDDQNLAQMPGYPAVRTLDNSSDAEQAFVKSIAHRALKAYIQRGIADAFRHGGLLGRISPVEIEEVSDAETVPFKPTGAVLLGGTGEPN